MYIARNIDVELEQWKRSNKRKPLMIRGARQVGKSSSVRHLSSQFEHYIELNFDENPQLTTIFQDSLSPKVICELIQAATNTPIVVGKTLLFFDEIQVCLPAISSLRYFYEQMPDLHLIAAGSLLEFALADLPSFGVGRVRSLFMYPLSFYEFLKAHREKTLLSVLQKSSPDNPLALIIHQKLIGYFKKFLVIGGMPEAVHEYIETGDLLATQRVLDDLVISIEADFAKYKNRISTGRIREVFTAIIKQNGSKFSYSYPNASLSNQQIKEVLELLKMAGLVYSVTHSAANGIPLGAEINPKSRKYLLFDTGILQRILGLNIGDIMIENDFDSINKGAIAELHVGLELIKNQSAYTFQELYYWQRESKNSQAEVDYIIQKQHDIVPIEVKAGNQGSMQSMYLFLKEKQASMGIRISLENFSKMDLINIYPLYAVAEVLK
jgi:uncharacterized protein